MVKNDNLGNALQPNISLQHLSVRLGVTERTLYNWRSLGLGPKGFRVGGYVRYRLEDVIAWEQEQLDKEADR